MNIMKYRKWYYIFTLTLIVPCLISLSVFGLKLSVDFTGGTQIEIEGTKDQSKVREIALASKFENPNITVTDKGLLLKTKAVNEENIKNFNKELKGVKGAQEVAIETVGPSISKEITQSAFISIILASILIIVYVAYAFRRVPKPARSFEFGVIAIIALLHDTIILLGVFSILGRLYNIEVDPLFITATLTVIGFSVHDTIVIFDRTRENLIKGTSESFEELVNRSNVQTLPRDISTTFLVWIIILVMYLFGGESIKYFLLALLVGIAAGTYSSIFLAAPLLITWQNFKVKRKLKQA